MERRDFFKACGAVGLFGISASADYRHHRMQPRVTCDLRCNDLPYQYRTGGGIGKVSATSQTELAIKTSPIGSRAKFYQWNTQALVFGHCSLSRMAVTLLDDGQWIASFRAEQNPLFPIETQQIIARGPDGKGGEAAFTNHLKRNTFRVTFRGFGGNPAMDLNPVTAPGKPALVEFNLAPFVVERAMPRDERIVSRDVAVKRFYDEIDRFEVEYTYE